MFIFMLKEWSFLFVVVLRKKEKPRPQTLGPKLGCQTDDETIARGYDWQLPENWPCNVNTGLWYMKSS